MYSLRQTQEFQDWLDGLNDRRAQVRIAARLRLAEAGNLGDWQPVGGEVSEMRVDFGQGIGFISIVEGSCSSSCSLAATSHHKNVTSSARSVSPRNWS